MSWVCSPPGCEIPLIEGADMRALLRNVGLPRNSKIGTGKIWPAPEGARRAKAFEIYRFDPDRHEGPRIDTYHVDLGSLSDCRLSPSTHPAGAEAAAAAADRNGAGWHTKQATAR